MGSLGWSTVNGVLCKGKLFVSTDHYNQIKSKLLFLLQRLCNKYIQFILTVLVVTDD